MDDDDDGEGSGRSAGSGEDDGEGGSDSDAGSLEGAEFSDMSGVVKGTNRELKRFTEAYIV